MTDCTELHAAGYHLLACDLRDIEGTKAKLEAAGIDRRLVSDEDRHGRTYQEH